MNKYERGHFVVGVTPETISGPKPVLNNILEYFSTDFQEIEAALDRHFSSHLSFVNEVSRHILFAGGKRLRPLLTVCSARLCGKQDSEVYDLSAVPEYLHAASLLHDDVVDEGQMRRGKLPAYKIWGNQAAVLVGDFLYAKAIELASRFGDVRIAESISRTVSLMAEGEILQLLQAKTPNFEEAAYLEIIYRKTAALISCSCQIGGFLASASPEQVEALGNYGLCVGQAFQMSDDILDYTADADELGKLVGTDLAEGKLTLPMVVALKEADRPGKEKLLRMLRSGKPSVKDLEWVQSLFYETGSFDYTRRRAEELIFSACESLGVFEECETRNLMQGLAHFVMERRN